MGVNVMRGRYYWLKLPRDFFDRADIRVLSAGSKGKSYLYIYLRLLCESMETDGYIHIRPGAAYTEHQLARWFGVQDSTMREALQTFKRCHLVQPTPYGGLFLSELATMVGSRNVHADTVRQLRASAPSHKQGASREARKAVNQGSTDGEATVDQGLTDGEATVDQGSTDGEATVDQGLTDGEATVDQQGQKSLTNKGLVCHIVKKCDTDIEIEKEIEIDTEQEAEQETQSGARGGRAEACGVDTVPAAPSVRAGSCVADHPPSREEVRRFVAEEGLHIDADGFYTYYAARGWMMRDGEQMLSWRSVAVWHSREGHVAMFERAARSELCRHAGDPVSKYEQWVQASEQSRLERWKREEGRGKREE